MEKKSNILIILNIIEKDYKNKNWNKKGNNPKSKNNLNNKIKKKIHIKYINYNAWPQLELIYN